MFVSELQVSDDKSIGLIVLSLARECHDFALSSGIPSHSVDHQLSLVFCILSRYASHLLNFRDVVAGDAPGLASLEIGFSDKGYLFLASAAKDRVAKAIDGNG